MTLYYMTSEKWGLVALKERRLKVSTIPELNDPFEMLGVAIGEKFARKVAKVLHRHWSQTIGLLCFIDNWHSPVMWAHYGDKHRGLCLGFDVPNEPDGTVNEVRYAPDRLRDVIHRAKPRLGIDEAVVHSILTTKFKEWSYEHEFRVFAELKERETNGLYYVDFGAGLRLREVIIGARCDLTVAHLAKAVGRGLPYSVRVMKARPAFDSFKIVAQKAVTPVTVRPRRPQK